MKTYLYIIFALLMIGCASPENPAATKELWEFTPKNNHPNFDRACLPLLNSYQELMKGVAADDTAYLFNAAKNMIQLTDSFPFGVLAPTDTVLNDQIKQSLSAINAELQGLIAEQNISAIHMATNMISVQFLNMLGSVGFKERNIYIFNVNDENVEDGLIWFGWNKTAEDVYHKDKKGEVTAQQLLQEK